MNTQEIKKTLGYTYGELKDIKYKCHSVNGKVFHVFKYYVGLFRPSGNPARKHIHRFILK